MSGVARHSPSLPMVRQRVFCDLPARVEKTGEMFVVADDKSSDTLIGLGLAAATNAAVTSRYHWQDYSELMRGKRIVIIPDGDNLSRRRLLDAASSFLDVAASVKVVELPGAQDVSEWAAALSDTGDAPGELMRIVLISTLEKLAGKAEPLDQRSLEALRARWLPTDDAPRRPRQLASLDALPGIWTIQGPEQTPVVQGVLGAGEVTILAGQPGLGKSYVALGLAVAVATGKPFCGRPTAQRPVLILDRENQQHMMRRRLEQLGGRDIPAEGLRFWAGWHEFPPEINSPLVAAFAKAGGLIIIDCFIRFFEGKSENDSVAIAQFMRPLLTLARIGGTVLLLHHSGKATTAQSYRGSSDFLAAVDASFVLKRDGNPADHLTTFTLKTIKTRAGSARDLRGRLTSSGFFGETSRPEPDEVSPSVAPPDPEAVRRKLVAAMDAKGVDRFSSDQAVEALDDYRITSAKQPASQLADILRCLDCSPKQVKIDGRNIRGYTRDGLAEGAKVAGSSHPRGSPLPATRYFVESKEVSLDSDGSGSGTEKGTRYPPEESPKVPEPEPQLPLLSDDDTEADYDEAARYGWKNLE